MIELFDDSEDENDRKIPAHHCSCNAAQHKKENETIDLLEDTDSNDEHDCKTEDETEVKKRAKAQKCHDGSKSEQDWGTSFFDKQLKEALEISKQEEESRKKYELEASTNSFPNDLIEYRQMNRQELENIINRVVDRQGGYDSVENGNLVKEGNGEKDFRKGTRDSLKGQSQTRAQYGRLLMKCLWGIFDRLQGVEADDDAKLQQKVESDEEKSKTSFIAKITAFVDIGHGIGIQVLQAAWSKLNVPSRGVELLQNRNLVAEQIRELVLEELRDNPPDNTLVEFEHADFTHAISINSSSNCDKKRDEQLRRFLLFQDKSEEIQKGLVIFVNNAEEVFSARSGDNGKHPTLDQHLAELFANMKVGGRMVTLTDIRDNFAISDWYCYHCLQSGEGAVSWNTRKSIPIHVLTKVDHQWTCQHKDCLSTGFGEEKQDIVKENGSLQDVCIYCSNAPSRRGKRKRK